jgi:hypothetical protein
MTSKALPLRLATFLLLGALTSCVACATASAIRNFGPSSAACSDPCWRQRGAVMLTSRLVSPARVPYEMVDLTYGDALKDPDAFSRWAGGAFWSRHGELELADDLVSRCAHIAAFSAAPPWQYAETGKPGESVYWWQYYAETGKPGESVYCLPVDPRLPLTPEPSPGDSLCKLEATHSSECAVIFYRSSSGTDEAPVAAYRADGSRLHVVSKRADDHGWFDLAVSPAVDTLMLTLFTMSALGVSGGS